MERWRDIPSYGGDYQVSNMGRVRSNKGSKQRNLSLVDSGNGYLIVELYSGSSSSGRLYQVHRLVAGQFLKPPSAELVEACNGGVVWVNHIDTDRGNNEVSNLEWCNPTHNNQHTSLCGNSNCTDRVGEKHWLSVLTESSVREAMELKSCGLTQKQIGEKLGIPRSTLASMFQGITWTHVTGLQRKKPKSKHKPMAEQEIVA